nr:MAG TPA: hypothetical protein [Caudoviricetes sp.]
MARTFRIQSQMFPDWKDCGMEFCQNVIVEHGKIVKDEEIIYNDYEWECPFPNLGG